MAIAADFLIGLTDIVGRAVALSAGQVVMHTRAECYIGFMASRTHRISRKLPEIGLQMRLLVRVGMTVEALEIGVPTFNDMNVFVASAAVLQVCGRGRIRRQAQQA